MLDVMPVMLDYRQRKRYNLCPDTVPMAILSEDQAQKTHGQSLSQLAQRGGMSPVEIRGNIQRLSLQETMALPMDGAVEFLLNLMHTWRF